MAIDMLDNIVQYAVHKDATLLTPHMTKHDLESVAWVALYSLYQRAYKDMQSQPGVDPAFQEVEKCMKEEFGIIVVAKRLLYRRRLFPFKLETMLPHITPDLRELAEDLCTLIDLQNIPEARAQRLLRTRGNPGQSREAITCDRFRIVLGIHPTS